MKRAWVLSGLIALGLAAQGNPVQAQEGGPMKTNRPVFSELDTNGDGQVTAEELEALHIARLSDIDTDGDGFLTAEEFQAHRAAQADERADRRLQRMIERMDTDGDGKVSLQEAQARSPGTRMIDRLDRNDDGAVSEEEFAQARDHGPRGQGARGDHGGKGGKDGRHGGDR